MNNRTIQIDFSEINMVHTSIGTLYHSVGQIIRGKIQSGEWKIGKKIPSERELMQVFNVSRATVRQGIANLVKEGILYRIQGKGTFVAPPKIDQGILRVMNFSDLASQTGLIVTSKLLAKEMILPPINIRDNLGLQDLDHVIWLKRLLLINDTPILIETSCFSAIRFPELINQYNGDEEPHTFVDKQYGVRVARAKESFEPVVMEDGEASILGSKGGFPGLWIEIIAYDEINNPVAYLTALLRGDRCRTYIDLVFDKGS